MAEKALAAWRRKYSTQQAKLSRDDPEPFKPGERLGYGGFGLVQETTLGGIKVALKRTFPKTLSSDARREVEILGRISRKRHRHIVELIGSYVYTEKKKGLYEIGLIMWPVAHCDLAHFMQELDVMRQYLQDTLPTDHTEDLSSVVRTLTALTTVDSSVAIGDLYELSLERLSTCFVCIAEALAWLHNEVHVRHKDLKPAQILISADGLWLTDFGLSKHIPNLDHSATTGIDTMTKKYQAPERASGLPCGRYEDIFGLGCVYLEMSYVLNSLPLEAFSPKDEKESWSYQENIAKNISPWTDRLIKGGTARAHHLGILLEHMLAVQPKQRPSLSIILKHLSVPFSDNCSFFSTCCSPHDPDALMRFVNHASVLEVQTKYMASETATHSKLSDPLGNEKPESSDTLLSRRPSLQHPQSPPMLQVPTASTSVSPPTEKGTWQDNVAAVSSPEQENEAPRYTAARDPQSNPQDHGSDYIIPTSYSIPNLIYISNYGEYPQFTYQQPSTHDSPMIQVPDNDTQRLYESQHIPQLFGEYESYTNLTSPGLEMGAWCQPSPHVGSLFGEPYQGEPYPSNISLESLHASLDGAYPSAMHTSRNARFDVTVDGRNDEHSYPDYMPESLAPADTSRGKQLPMSSRARDSSSMDWSAEFQGCTEMSDESGVTLGDDDNLTSSDSNGTGSSSPNTIACQDCGMSFTGKYRKGNLARHCKRRQSADIYYSCAEDTFDRVFKRRDSLSENYRTNHP